MYNPWQISYVHINIFCIYRFHAVLEYHDGVSSFYIGFFSFIVVGVIIMNAAVTVTNIRTNAQGVGFVNYSLIYSNSGYYEMITVRLNLN